MTTTEATNGDSHIGDDTKVAKNWCHTLKWILLYFSFYFAGLAGFLALIADPLTISTYFSDNSLLPGLVNREFSLGVEAEYYLKDLTKHTKNLDKDSISLAGAPAIVDFIEQELDSFGLEVFKQRFHNKKKEQSGGLNIYSIIRGERSTSAESIVLCVPLRVNSESNTLSSVALGLAMAKYFSTKSYWSKDVIILFIDQYYDGLSAWLDSYYDINFHSDLKQIHNSNDDIHYESLIERSGPMQAAIVLELNGNQFSRVNVKIQGSYGQLPNLDLFNLVIEIAARESVTPYFYNKSLPFDLSQEELYMHHLETALSFMQSQATMNSDGLHGLFLSYAVQSLTIEGPKYVEPTNTKFRPITTSLLNIGRLVEGVFRSLNNLTERFNRSYYFYIILSLRRFTSIGYYMIPISLMIAPVILKAHNTHKEQSTIARIKEIVLLISALALSLCSTLSISLAMISSVILVPVLLLV